MVCDVISFVWIRHQYTVRIQCVGQYDSHHNDDDDECVSFLAIFLHSRLKRSITSKIKLAVKHKTSPARLAQLLQPSLAFCFSLQPMTACRPALDGTPSLAAS